jgi:signal transduction histidine kinase
LKRLVSGFVLAVSLIVAFTTLLWMSLTLMLLRSFSMHETGRLLSLDNSQVITAVKNAKKPENRSFHLQDSLGKILLSDKISLSAVFDELKTPVAVWKSRSSDFYVFGSVEYPLSDASNVIGYLKVRPNMDFVFHKATSGKYAVFAALWLLGWFCLTVFLLWLYFYFNLFLPLEKVSNFVDTLENDEFTPTNLGSIYSYWRYIAVRLNKLYEKIYDTRSTTNMLFSISKSLSSTLEINDISDQILLIIQKKYEDGSCAIMLLEDDGFLKIKNHRGLSLDFVDRTYLRPGEGYEGQAFKDCRAVTINDFSHETPFINIHMLEQEGVSSFMHVPLKIEEKCIGLLCVYARKKNFFTDDKIKTISTLGEYLSIGMRNAKLYEKINDYNRKLGAEITFTTKELMQTNSRLIQRAREMKALSDIAAFAASKVNLSEIIKMITDRLKELMSIQEAGFLLYLKDTGDLVPYPPFFGIKDSEFSYLRFKLGESDNLSKMVKERTAMIYNIPEDAKNALPVIGNLVSIHSMALVPLCSQNKVIGILGVANKFGEPFNDNDKNLLVLIADRISGIIDNVLLYRELEQRIHDLSAMQEVSSTITREPVLNDILKNIVSITTKAFEADLCALILHDREKNMLVTQPGAHFTGGEEIVSKSFSVDDPDSLLSKVFNEGKAFVTPDASIDPQIKKQDIKFWDIRSLILVPLTAENRVIGVLRIGRHKANAYSSDDVRLASLIANQSSTIIDNAQLYESLKITKDEMVKLNQLKNEFLSIVSHELKTPITAIKGFVKVVLNGDTGALNDQQSKFLKVADHSIDRMIMLISELLDISRIESGNMNIKPECINSRALVEDILKNFNSDAYGKLPEVEIEIPGSIPEVAADKDRLIQVFENLIVNAVKFTAENGTIKIYASDRGDFVKFGVKDNGVGIEDKDINRIFDKFYRADTPYNKTIAGAGLGLSIVKSIVEMHGGTVWVESCPGRGSDFQFMLPRAKTEIKDFRKQKNEK